MMIFQNVCVLLSLSLAMVAGQEDKAVAPMLKKSFLSFEDAVVQQHPNLRSRHLQENVCTAAPGSGNVVICGEMNTPNDDCQDFGGTCLDDAGTYPCSCTESPDTQCQYCQTETSNSVVCQVTGSSLFFIKDGIRQSCLCTYIGNGQERPVAVCVPVTEPPLAALPSAVPPTLPPLPTFNPAFTLPPALLPTGPSMAPAMPAVPGVPTGTAAPVVVPVETVAPVVVPVETAAPVVVPVETVAPVVVPVETAAPVPVPAQTAPPSVAPVITTAPPVVAPAQTAPPTNVGSMTPTLPTVPGVPTGTAAPSALPVPVETVAPVVAPVVTAAPVPVPAQTAPPSVAPVITTAPPVPAPVAAPPADACVPDKKWNFYMCLGTADYCAQQATSPSSCNTEGNGYPCKCNGVATTCSYCLVLNDKGALCQHIGHTATNVTPLGGESGQTCQCKSDGNGVAVQNCFVPAARAADAIGTSSLELP